ncbi:MAG: YajQ family cyclic di-GMP-binding protein [Phycisphaerales bacterium]
MASTPSLDIVSRVDFAELDNAVNNTHKAVQQRFDYRGVRTEINVDQKEKKIQFIADEGKLKGLLDMFLNSAAKRNISMKAFDMGEIGPGPAGTQKCEAKVRAGLEQETAKKIVKMIKDTGLKVQASIQGDEIRLSGKQIDDLRNVMTMLQKSDIEAPLQFVNMK